MSIVYLMYESQVIGYINIYQFCRTIVFYQQSVVGGND